MADLYGEIRTSLFSGMNDAGLSCNTDLQLKFKEELKSTEKILSFNPSFREAFDDVDIIQMFTYDPITFAKVSERVFAFGYLISEMFAWTANLSGESKMLGCERGAWLNIGISLFDLLVDEIPETSIVLQKTFNKRMLLDWISTGSSHFSVPTTYPLVNLLWKIISHIFQDLNEIDVENDPYKKSEIRKTFTSMLSGELHSLKMYFRGKPPAEVIYKNLVAKSVLPYWAMALLTVGSAIDQKYMQRWKNLSLILGEFYALVDDARDIVTDTFNERWNIITWKIAQQEPHWFKKGLSAEFRLQQIEYYIIESNMLYDWTCSLTTRLFKQLRFIEVDKAVEKKILERLAGSTLNWYS